MYSHFRWVIVDWKRGLLRFNGGSRKMILSQEFFHELSWWEENVRLRCSIPLLARRRKLEAVITGTDASDLGCGAVAWLAGAREEFQQLWGPFEKSLPINMRELIGATRILEHWGPRLKGKKVILESDNMATVWCVRRRHARTDLMAEQLRRLYTVAARWDIEISIIHGPGVDLRRPDGVSRGDDPAQPRQRLTAAAFGPLEQRWGPFEEGLGAEMELPQRSGPLTGTERRIWLHPAHHTIASTMKSLNREISHSRMEPASIHNRPLSGLIVLPEWEAAQWQSLTSGLRKIASWNPGESVLEE